MGRCGDQASCTGLYAFPCYIAIIVWILHHEVIIYSSLRDCIILPVTMDFTSVRDSEGQRAGPGIAPPVSLEPRMSPFPGDACYLALQLGGAASWALAPAPPRCAQLQADFSLVTKAVLLGSYSFMANVRTISLKMTLPTVEGQKEAGCPKSCPRLKNMW